MIRHCFSLALLCLFWAHQVDAQSLSGAAANQGSPGSLANAWPVKPTDGTNAVTVKAGSAAAAATDTSLVVGISPNIFGQATMANSLPVAIASNQSAVPASQSGNWTTRIVGNAGATLDAAGQNVASPANELLVGCQFNAVPTTIANGNVSPCQMDNAGNILVSLAGAAADTKVNIDRWGGTLTTLGQKAMASSVPVAIASDQSAVPASQSGTWTVQPGNTANTTPWLMTINQGGNSATVSAANNLNVAVNLALPAGSAIIGKVGIDQTTDVTTNGVEVAPTAGAAAAIVSAKSAAAETARVVKASGGNLYGFEVTSGASAGFVLVLNSTTDPGNGAVTPVKCYQLPANTTLGVSWNPGPPIRLGTGITIVFSTTGCFTETQSATAFISAEAS